MESGSFNSACFIVRLNNDVKLVVPFGSLELVVLGALRAGTDVSVVSVDNYEF